MKYTLFFGLALTLGLLLSGCQQASNSGNSNTVANANANQTAVAPTNTNTAVPAASPIEQKAQAIAGTWKTTTALGDEISFDFSQPKKEGESYVGTYVFDVNGSKDPSAKYIVSADKMIKFFDQEGKEYPLIKVSISDDGKTLTYFDQKGGQSKLVKAGSQVKTKTESPDGEKGDCTVKEDNVELYNEANEKTVKLKKGTSVQYVMYGNQGLAIVKAQIDGKWVRGEIQDDLLDCPDEREIETKKK